VLDFVWSSFLLASRGGVQLSPVLLALISRSTVVQFSNGYCFSVDSVSFLQEPIPSRVALLCYCVLLKFPVVLLRYFRLGFSARYFVCRLRV
jgi:hypothetical protein